MRKAPEAFRTISEAAEDLQTPAHVLRFWESRFTQIKPVKRAGGRRYYRPGDIDLLAGIRVLLHDQGMTIRGVQKLLQEKGARHVADIGTENLRGDLIAVVADSDNDALMQIDQIDSDTAALPEDAEQIPELSAEDSVPKDADFESMDTEPEREIRMSPTDLDEADLLPDDIVAGALTTESAEANPSKADLSEAAVPPDAELTQPDSIDDRAKGHQEEPAESSAEFDTTPVPEAPRMSEPEPDPSSEPLVQDAENAIDSPAPAPDIVPELEPSAPEQELQTDLAAELATPHFDRTRALARMGAHLRKSLPALSEPEQVQLRLNATRLRDIVDRMAAGSGRSGA